MHSQPDFFGVPDEPEPSKHTAPAEKPKRRASEVGPATASSDAEAAAGKLPASIRLGTSSWSYPGWDGLIYDGAFSDAKLAREGLAAYAKHPLMHTVGIDRTFYAPIGAADYAKYAAQVPPAFRFLVKAPMAVTSPYVRDDTGRFSDSPYYLDADYTTREFVTPCMEGLGAKAGPLVFQFPPQGRDATYQPDRFVNRLYRFLKALPVGPLYAVEIRDPELMTHRFFMCLKTTGVRYCLAIHANMPGPAEQLRAMNQVLEPGPLIARWSLHSGFKYEAAKERYLPFNRLVDEDPDSRAVLAAACVASAQAGHETFIIVNNKAEGSSPLSIEKLATAIADLGSH